ncbi:MAG: glycosyltransferase family 2 protein [Clostridium sp.]|nr:glycosyltransferase family 2 protein [Clostridium sp.]
MKKVSIIIAAYNIEEYISRCIESCINQTYDNIEIIIVNDGSTDRTLEIINKYRENKKIIVINKDNEGLIEARKSGYKVATGEYVLFIDGDDWLNLNAINQLYMRAIETDADIVWYKYLFAYDNNTFKKKIVNRKFDCIDGYEFLERVLVEDILPSIWSKFLKKSFIDNNKIEFPNKITFCEDLAFSVSLGIHKPKTTFLDKRLYYYYQRDNAVTKIVSNKLLDIGEAIKFIRNELERNDLMETHKEEFEYCAYLHSLYYRSDIIFRKNNIYSKEMFKNWNVFNINIYNNKYFNRKFKEVSFKGRVATIISSKNYYLGRIISRIC